MPSCISKLAGELPGIFSCEKDLGNASFLSRHLVVTSTASVPHPPPVKSSYPDHTHVHLGLGLSGHLIPHQVLNLILLKIQNNNRYSGAKDNEKHVDKVYELISTVMRPSCEAYTCIATNLTCLELPKEAHPSISQHCGLEIQCGRS